MEVLWYEEAVAVTVDCEADALCICVQSSCRTKYSGINVGKECILRCGIDGPCHVNVIKLDGCRNNQHVEDSRYEGKALQSKTVQVHTGSSRHGLLVGEELHCHFP